MLEHADICGLATAFHGELIATYLGMQKGKLILANKLVDFS